MYAHERGHRTLEMTESYFFNYNPQLQKLQIRPFDIQIHIIYSYSYKLSNIVFRYQCDLTSSFKCVLS